MLQLIARSLAHTIKSKTQGLKASKCLQHFLQARSGQKPLRSQEQLRNGLYRIARQFIQASQMLLGFELPSPALSPPQQVKALFAFQGRFSPKLFPGDFLKHLYMTLSQVPLSKKARRTEDLLAKAPTAFAPACSTGPEWDPKSTWNWRSPSSEAPLRAGKR